MRTYWGIAAILTVLATPAMGFTAAEKCVASKLTLAGKYAFCLLSTQAKSVKTGTDLTWQTCYEKSLPRFFEVDGKGIAHCPVVGNAEAILYQTGVFAEELGAMIGAGSASAVSSKEKCQIGKLKTAGKYAFCRLKAAAKAVKSGASADFSKCDEKYATKWAAIESKADGQCPVNGDQLAIRVETTEFSEAVAAAIAGTDMAVTVP